MATTSSTKPGEIGGTSILAKRSPTYRLVLKVDPTTGQYKYEYEVDDAPKVSDVIQSATPVVPEVPDTGGDGDSTPTFGKITPDPVDPGTSFEQTKRMLGGGGEKGPMQNLDSGEYRMNDDGSVGYRRANQDSFITVSKTSPGAQRFMAGLTKGVSAVTNTITDYATTGGIIGSAIKNVFSGSKAATKEYDGSYNQMPAGFVDGGEPDKPTDNRRPDSMGVSSTRKSLAPSFTAADLQKQISDLKSKRNSLNAGNYGNANASAIDTVNKEIQQTNSLLNRQMSNAGTPPTSAVKDLGTTTPRGPGELGASTRSDVGEAVREGNIQGAINAARRSVGTTPSGTKLTGPAEFGRTTSEAGKQEINSAHAAAATNNSVSNYGSNKSNDRRDVEKNKDVAAAREAAKNTEAEKSREVNSNNAVDNAARSNEVSDKNGNAVTNNGKAINFGGKKETGMKSRADVARDKAAKEKEKAAKGDKGDKKGRIICSELYNKRLISKEDYMLDLYYTSKHLTPQHTAGYWHFAVPAVKAMRRSKFWTEFWREIAYNRLQDIKWRLGYGKFTLKGRIYSAIFEPFCYISGYFKPNATYKELYKGEY
jgi:hypothetical protein